VSPEPKWYEELMRLRDLGRVSKTPRSQLEPFKPQSPFKGLLRSNFATEMINPPALTPDWHEEEFLELQKDRGKNLERFLNWDYKNMKPGETFTKANQWDIPNPNIPEETYRKKLPKTLYHGSPKFKGDRFDLGKTQARDHGYYGEGVYLTSNPYTASSYADPKGGMFHLEPEIKGASPEVIPVYANIKNPLDMSELTTEHFKKFAEAVKRFPKIKKSKYTTGTIIKGSDYRDRLALMFEKYAEADFDRISGETGGIGSFLYTYKKGTKSEQKRKLPYLLKDLFNIFEDATGFNRSDLIKEAGYDSTIIGGGNEVIIYDPRRIKSMFNQGTFNPLTGDLHTNLGFGTNYASRA
jgi:hypothetical protein